MSISLNNSTNYNSTMQIPNQIIYGFQIRETLNLLRFNESEFENNHAFRINTGIFEITAATSPKLFDENNHVFRFGTGNSENAAAVSIFPTDVQINIYRPYHIDTKNAIAFAAIKIKKYYNSKHKPKFFNVVDFVSLRLHRGY